MKHHRGATPHTESRILRQPGVSHPRLGLRAKLIFPYLLLALVVALIAAYLVTRVVLASWTERFNNQLFSAADEAADIVVGYEQEQLAAWRQIAFTQGVAEAVATRSITELEQLVQPIYLNLDASRLDIVDNVGAGLFQLGQDSQASPLPNYAAWPVIKQVQTDPTNRYAGLQAVGDKVYFYTAGALTSASGETTGILLLGTALDELAVRLEESVLAGISLYDPDGQLLASTIGLADRDALRLSPDRANEVLQTQAEGTIIRTITPAQDEYAQVLVPFKLGPGQDVGVLGVSLRLQLLASPLYPARQVVTFVFTTAVAATMLIGYLIASSIIRPVERLMEASHRVAAGDLTVRVKNKSRDEIGRLTESFNHMVTQLRQRRYIEDMFGRYVGDNIAQRILNGEAELGGQRVYGSILFADIRDFTTFAEKADLTSLIDELNEYYTIMQRVIDAHGGVVNKFGGDSILAIFGTPVPNLDHANQAVQAAVKMMDQLALLNRRRQARHEAPFRIGIGINTGAMIVGNLGSENRREYTVLGDSVNTAKRLSDLNKDTPVYSIFISGQTLAELDDRRDWNLENLGDTQVKGKFEAVPVYAVLHGLAMEVA
jgi:class 3 adenylate cyclase